MRLTVDRVSMTFGKKEVLSEISFELDSPSFTAIRGPSGSGKTTLLSIIAGHMQPTEGKVHFDSSGEDLSVDWIIQSAPLLNHRSVLHNIMLGALIQGRSDVASVGAAVRAARSVGISNLLRRKAFVLSGGERQRVAIARSVASEHPVILADEPTASLDATSREKVCQSLALAARLGSIVLVATHDDFVATFADKIINVSPTSV
ncbi:ABC transporter ATP-binding protein [Paenarthrobacter sp. NPDC090520]|uniref:ABC transporter ATP-binding protein n=1 Tax=Paenarthrobacter sp. NPDC090520 TaxID=3364382 RepID=UPI00380D12CF